MKIILKNIFLLILILTATNFSFAQEDKKKMLDQPVIVNGDTVEYSTDSKSVTATGNVFISYKGAKLTCDKIVVDMNKKIGKAQGNVRLEDEKGIMLGEEIEYNFDKKTGSIINASFLSSPYFGKAKELKRLSDEEFVSYRGYLTTCSFDVPHYRIKSRKTKVFPGNKIQTEEDTLYIGKWPIISIPRYSHMLTDPMMHVQLTPGTSSKWGPYLLSAWRYNLTDYIDGRIYLDYRDKLGFAEGFGANYDTQFMGKGDFKFYYSSENDKKLKIEPTEFERYLIRHRHKWDISDKTNLVSEYYQIEDSKRILLGPDHNILKDYFYREYEQDAAPLSYTLFHHYFNYSSLDILLQKRTNRWYTQLEKLPEIKYSLPSYQIGELPLYFDNISSMASYNYKNAVPSDSSSDVSMNRIDTLNKLSMPVRLSFFNVTPFIGSRETFYSKDIQNKSLWSSPRTIFMTGADISTKFYKLFDVNSDFMGMDFNGIRHIITPTVGYAYNHDPTIGIDRLKQIDDIDTLESSNYATIGLTNTFQTKRDSATVDFLTVKLTSPYYFKSTRTYYSGFGLEEFKLTFLPYSWLRFDADADYDRKQSWVSEANYDFNLMLMEGRSIGLGQRYLRKGEDQITLNVNWKLTPKWSVGLYERYQFKKLDNVYKGLAKQEYRFIRDLHCWTMEFGYTIEKRNEHTIWIIFRLKAFPEFEVNLDQGFSSPSSGSNNK